MNNLTNGVLQKAIAWFGDWAIAFALLLYCSYLLLLKQDRYYKIFQTLQN
ncbi:hypothetical protein H6G04_30305 [Calothrix membranacea FACHB-236]|nr:hypothetical protein [Calothrix membranacea FACHB-236]